jgi:glycosyltransferase involved in cell wall biosynthesis
VTRRPRLLFVQPSLQPPGGGNGVAAWMLQALKDEYEITVYTWWPVDVERINRFWGTSIRADDFRATRVPTWLRRLVDAPPLPLAMLRTAVMINSVRRRSAEYDLAITANNEADFGSVGVQYVHYPWNMFPRPAVDLRWYHFGFLLAPYYRLCVALSRFSADSMRRNITLVNSDWTGRQAWTRYQIASRTVYPPVRMVPSSLGWEARVPEFVAIGRIAPEKELERVIDVMTAVRAQVPAVRLHVVGTTDQTRYYRRIVRRIRAAGDWIQLHEDLSRSELDALIGRVRYGIHGMREEHFGMAPAEMVRAGCIVWVPDGGGQVEIVGDARLTYGSIEEGVAKITRTLGDADEQARLRAHLATRASLFSTERFMQQVRAAVAEAAALAQGAVAASSRKPASRASSSS